MTTATVHLHVPDEPIAEREQWRAAVLAGAPVAHVVDGADGVAEWLWLRWRAIEVDGISLDDLRVVSLGARRELWLWMVGERTWPSTVSTLLGRLSRR